MSGVEVCLYESFLCDRVIFSFCDFHFCYFLAVEWILAAYRLNDLDSSKEGHHELNLQGKVGIEGEIASEGMCRVGFHLDS